MKLIIDEPESSALERHLEDQPVLATSRIALVEVPRATGLANPGPEVQEEVERLLRSCMLIDLSDALLRAAAGHASRAVRTLDSIHIASALRIQADQLLAYDRRLAAAAVAGGLAVVSPGAAAVSSRRPTP